MKISIQYFGMVEEITKLKNEYFEITSESITKNELINLLHLKYPKLSDITYNIAHNLNIVKENIYIQHNDQVALLPPFAGG